MSAAEVFAVDGVEYRFTDPLLIEVVRALLAGEVTPHEVKAAFEPLREALLVEPSDEFHFDPSADPLDLDDVDSFLRDTAARLAAIDVALEDESK